MEEDQIRRLVEELDQLTPRDGARVRLDQYGGGPEESRFVANQSGYFRFDIEFLKAGLLDGGQDEIGRNSLTVDLKYLVTADSVGFDDFIRDDSISDVQQSQTPNGNLVGLALGVGCLAVGALAIVGLIAVIRFF